MFTFDKGRPIAKFISGKNKDKVTLKLLENDDNESEILGSDIEFNRSKIIPIPNEKSKNILYSWTVRIRKKHNGGEYITKL